MTNSSIVYRSCPAASLDSFVVIVALGDSLFILIPLLSSSSGSEIYPSSSSSACMSETSKFSGFRIDCLRCSAPSSGRCSGRLLKASGFPLHVPGRYIILKLLSANRCAQPICHWFHTFVFNKFWRFWWSVYTIIGLSDPTK